MLLLSCLAVFLLVLSAVSVYGYFAFVRPGSRYAELEQASDRLTLSTQPFYQVVSFVERLGRLLPMDEVRASGVKRALVACGWRDGTLLSVVSGSRLVIALGGACLVSVRFPAGSVMGLLGLVVALLVGYRLPELLVNLLAKRRRDALRLSLPDALDLMVVCVEAGLGLDQAMRSVTREIEEIHPALADELRLVSLEMSAGTRRADALANLAERTGEPELKKFTAVLIQADRFGTSLGDALRTHADFMRVRRKQLAEERAGKVSVKMIFPVFFFILPSILLVAAGPAVIAISNTLMPLLQGLGN